MKLSALGFPQIEENKLGKILPLAKARQFTLQNFNHTQLPDILVLFGEVSQYREQLQLAKQNPAIKIVVVSRQAPAHPDYHHLPFPLVASRVLRLLDTLAEAESTDKSPGAAAAPVTATPIVTPLPPTPVEVPAIQPPETSTKPAPSATGLPYYTVLVVDDSVPMQTALAMELEKMSATVSIDFAGTGEEALAMTLEKTYDFIFLDIMMPGIDGYEACAEMRKRPGMKKTPIIMLSAKTSPLDEVKGVISGCTTYLTKPIVHEDFQKVVQRITKWVDNFNAQNTTPN